MTVSKSVLLVTLGVMSWGCLLLLLLLLLLSATLEAAGLSAALTSKLVLGMTAEEAGNAVSCVDCPLWMATAALPSRCTASDARSVSLTNIRAVAC